MPRTHSLATHLMTASLSALAALSAAVASPAQGPAANLAGHRGDLPPPVALAHLQPAPPTTFRDRQLPARHRGLILLDNGEYGSTADAEARGMICHQGRWVAKAYRGRVKRWTAADRRIRSWDDARKYRARHYRIETDLPAHIVELDVIPFLDALYATYTDVFARRFGARGRGASNKDIRIYRSFSEYSFEESLADGRRRPRSNPAFIRDGQLLVTYWDATDPDAFYKNVCHEAAHQFVKALYPGVDLPKWLDEGIASYFEGCRWSPSLQEVVFDGRIASTRLNWARQLIARAKRGGLRDGHANLARHLVLSVRDDHFGANEYALATTLVHYLVHRCQDMRRGAFGRFLDELDGAGNRPFEQSWRKATRTDFDTLAEGWADHVASLPQTEDPEWCVLAVAGQGELNIQDGDHVFRIDGCEVFDARHFEKLWKDRDPADATELVLVRRGDQAGSPDRDHALVTVSVPRDAKLQLKVKLVQARNLTIID